MSDATRAGAVSEDEKQERQRHEDRSGDQQHGERDNEHSSCVMNAVVEREPFAPVRRPPDDGHFDFGGLARRETACSPARRAIAPRASSRSRRLSIAPGVLAGGGAQQRLPFGFAAARAAPRAAS